MTIRFLLVLISLAMVPTAKAAQCTGQQVRMCNLECGPPADVGEQQFQKCLCTCTAKCSGTVCSSGGGSRGSETHTATVGNTVASPIYVNLYWDDTWDVDNPSTPFAALDSFTTALLSSSYVNGLSEYGVTGASYGGGFFPAAACPQKPPARVGFYDPFNTSIIGFLNCEILHGGLPTQSNVIYNVILPAFSLESDLFGNATQCQNVSAGGWHFHNTPYNPAVSASIAAALLVSGGTPLGLQDLLPLLNAVTNSGPIYTINSAAVQCGVLTNSLVHEMIEAATDPFPPLSVIFSGSGEIADACESSPTNPFPPKNAFVPPISSALPIQLAGDPNGVPFATPAVIQVPQFFSNQGQACITGFTDTTAPSIPPAIAVRSGQGPALNLSVAGTGLGTIPAPFVVGADISLPYIAIQDLTQNWQAGNSLNSDLFGIHISSWSPNAIAISGIAGVGTDFTMQSTDSVSIWICNPASGNCATGRLTFPTGPTMPNLAIALSIAQPQQNVPFVIVYVDGVSHGSLGNDQATPWIPVTAGTHTVSARTSNIGYTMSYGGSCNAKGQVTLTDGQNLHCVLNVTNNNIINNSGCPSGTHCCGAGIGHCLPRQCVSNRGFSGNSCP